MSKRKMPHRELPFISTLLDKLPYSKLPTNGVVLRRLMFETQEHNGSGGISTASITVMEELVKVWEYAGYGDILQDISFIKRKISTLHGSYRKLTKIPFARRQTESFKKNEDKFTKSLELLFDITLKSLHGSGLITAEDREFLVHHWDKTVSSTRDSVTKLQVEKKLAREEQYQKFSSSNSTPQCSKTLPLSDDSSNSPADSCEEFTPKRPCTSQPSGTTVHISKDFLKKLGPAADRLNLSNNVLTSVVAAVTNHGGGDIQELSLSKSSTRRHRASANTETSSATLDRLTLMARYYLVLVGSERSID